MERPMGIHPAGAAETPLVELRALTKVYPEGGSERVVFRDLSAGIRRGETVALLGRSGSGKSTLLNLIGGIDTPTAGEVILDGTSLSALSEQGRTLFRRRHIGLVFQSFNLIPTLTVMENLLLPLELTARPGNRHALRLRTSSARSGSPTGPGRTRTAFPAGSSSGSRWPARWSTSRSCCWRTSRRGVWTRKRGGMSSGSSSGSRGPGGGRWSS